MERSKRWGEGKGRREKSESGESAARFKSWVLLGALLSLVVAGGWSVLGLAAAVIEVFVDVASTGEASATGMVKGAAAVSMMSRSKRAGRVL